MTFTHKVSVWRVCIAPSNAISNGDWSFTKKLWNLQNVLRQMSFSFEMPSQCHNIHSGSLLQYQYIWSYDMTEHTLLPCLICLSQNISAPVLEVWEPDLLASICFNALLNALHSAFLHSTALQFPIFVFFSFYWSTTAVPHCTCTPILEIATNSAHWKYTAQCIQCKPPNLISSLCSWLVESWDCTGTALLSNALEVQWSQMHPENDYGSDRCAIATAVQLDSTWSVTNAT